MSFVLAILVGAVGGIIGALPFVVARSRIKARLKKDGMGSIVTGMAATLISFAIMAVEIVLCSIFAKEVLLPFSISAIVIFLVAMIAYTATLMRK